MLTGGTFQYYKRVLLSVEYQLRPRLVFVNMWVHLKTKKPQNSSQCTLADQKAVTDSSKPPCHRMWLLQTQYRSADWEEVQGKPVQVIYNHVTSQIRWHLTAVRLTGAVNSAKINGIHLIRTCYVTTIRHLAVLWVMESVTRLHKIPWPFMELTTTIRDKVLPRTAREGPERDYFL